MTVLACCRKKLYHNSVTVSKLKNSDSKGRILVEVRNNSDFTFELQPANAGFPGASLQPNSTELIRLEPDKTPARLQYTIANWFIDTGKNPTVTHQL